MNMKLIDEEITLGIQSVLPFSFKKTECLENAEWRLYFKNNLNGRGNKRGSILNLTRFAKKQHASLDIFGIRDERDGIEL